MNYLPRLVLNHSPPDLCLPRSWDYRSEAPVPSRREVLTSSSSEGAQVRLSAPWFPQL
jgi:hypothetical protein